jgi:serine/threonine-protein kinase RsbW
MALEAELTLDSRISEIARAREWVSEHARAAGFPDATVRNLGLVVSEACANVIKYAYQGQPNQPVELRLTADEAKLELSIRDHGAKFDLNAYTPPDLDEPREGGYGIYIIRSLMDEVEYDTSAEQGTTLRLVKYRDQPASPA